MGDLMLAMVSWLGFLQRPDVLVQLLAIALAVLLARRLRGSPWLGRPCRPSWLPGWIRRPPVALAETGALVLAIPLLNLAGQESGLVLLIAQLKAAWLALELVEKLLLSRWLDPVMASRLSSRPT